jgi:hypothetical protein
MYAECILVPFAAKSQHRCALCLADGQHSYDPEVSNRRVPDSTSVNLRARTSTMAAQGIVSDSCLNAGLAR